MPRWSRRRWRRRPGSPGARGEALLRQAAGAPALGRAPGGGPRHERARRSGAAARPRRLAARETGSPGGPGLRRGRPGPLRPVIACAPRTRTRPAMSEEEFRLLRDEIHAHCGLWYRDELRLPAGEAAAAAARRRSASRLRRLPPLPALRPGARGGAGRGGRHPHHQRDLLLPRAVPARRPSSARSCRRWPGRRRPRAAARASSRPAAAPARRSTRWPCWSRTPGSSRGGRWSWSAPTSRGAAWPRPGPAPTASTPSARPRPAPLRRWFHLRGGKWVVDDALRAMVRFQRENLVSPRALSPRWPGSTWSSAGT